MPLEVKDIEWTETDQNVALKVPLKGAATKNVDIFSSSNYIKVSFPPYFYEVGLYDAINDESSKATIANGVVVFHLQKVESKLWGQLHVSQHKDKAFMKELRDKALKYKQEKEQERSKKHAVERDQQKKFAVRQQMRVDSEERKLREDRKRDQMAEISENIEKWKLKDCNGNDESNMSQQESVDGAQEMMSSRKEPATEITGGSLVAIKNGKNKAKNIEMKPEEVKHLPEPRVGGNINVNFTPRQLPTPARESKLPEEEIWLKKVAEMNKIKKVENPDDVADIEEMNPVWLKDKGNDFFKNGNYVAAINAYTSALVLDSKIPMIYANRAACHLTLKQFKECIQDCSYALELYDPPVPSNAMSRCRALTRRGTAYYQVGHYVDALRDYEAAIKLDPKNNALRSDAFKIRRTLQGGDSSD